jgi:hypothetical protein
MEEHIKKLEDRIISLTSKLIYTQTMLEAQHQAMIKFIRTTYPDFSIEHENEILKRFNDMYPKTVGRYEFLSDAEKQVLLQAKKFDENTF